MYEKKEKFKVELEELIIFLLQKIVKLNLPKFQLRLFKNKNQYEFVVLLKKRKKMFSQYYIIHIPIYDL